MLAPLLTLSLAALSVVAAPHNKRTTYVAGSDNCVTPNPVRESTFKVTNTITCASKWHGITTGSSFIEQVIVGPTLNTAGKFSILSKTGISAVPKVSILGNIGVAPVAQTYITGFSLDQTKTGSYSAESYMITGVAYGADSTNSPSPQAIEDAVGAYNIGMGTEYPTLIDQAAGALDSLSLYKGLYKWNTDVTLGPGAQLFLNGNAGDVFIFQTSGAFNFASKAQIILSTNLTPDSIYWFAATSADFGQYSSFSGLMSTYTTITVRENAAITGRLQAQTFVSLLGGMSIVPSKSP